MPAAARRLSASSARPLASSAGIYAVESALRPGERQSVLRVVCKLQVDPVRHLGCMDVIDAETGEVLKTAKDVMMEQAAQYPDLRPCGRETEFLRGGWAEKKSCKRCKNCKKWWDE